MIGIRKSDAFDTLDPSSNKIVASVGRKLKYYLEVKRREDGFDLTSSYLPRVAYPHIKKRLVVMYDGARRCIPSLPHNFADKEIRQRFTHLKLKDSKEDERAERSQSVETGVEESMENTVVREYFVPHGYCQRDRFGNIVVVNPMKSLQYGTSAYGSRQKSPFPGAYPLLRSTTTPFVSQSEASRLVNVASRVIACTEVRAPEKEELMKERDLAVGIGRRYRSPRNTPTPPRGYYTAPSSANTLTPASSRNSNKRNIPEIYDEPFEIITPSSDEESPRSEPQKSEKELAVRGLTKYEVYVQTGNENGSSTKAPVFIMIYGSSGRSQNIPLTVKHGSPAPFQKGNCDKFELVIPCVGKIHHIQIGHDSDQMQNAWYLDTVIIHDHKQSQRVEFSCKSFLQHPKTVVNLSPVKRTTVEPPKDEPKKRESIASSSHSRSRSHTPENSEPETSSDLETPRQTSSAELSITSKNNFFDAVKRNDTETVSQFFATNSIHQLLLARDRRGMGALHIAAAEGANDVLKLLNQNGASVESTSNDSLCTALHYAASCKRVKTVELLLSLGASPIALTSPSKATPLHLAATSGHIGTCRAVLSSEHPDTFAALSMRDINGCRPVDIARQERYYDIEEFLNREANSLEASITHEDNDEYDRELRRRSGKDKHGKKAEASRPISVQIASPPKPVDDDFYKDAEV